MGNQPGDPIRQGEEEEAYASAGSATTNALPYGERHGVSAWNATIWQPICPWADNAQWPTSISTAGCTEWSAVLFSVWSTWPAAVRAAWCSSAISGGWISASCQPTVSVRATAGNVAAATLSAQRRASGSCTSKDYTHGSAPGLRNTSPATRLQ
jgi:hypothetical protein